MGARFLNRRWLFYHLLVPSIACLALSCSDDNDVVEAPVDYSLPVGHRYPTWSVDGDSLYYVDLGIVGLTEGGYRVNPDSVGLRVISRSGGHGRMVVASRLSTYTLSPDGSALCMARNGNLFVGAFDRGKLNEATFQQITTIGSTASPSWGAGDWIVFESEYQDPRGARAIWKVSADGNELIDLSVHGTGEWLMPSWDAAGTKIAYVRYVDDTIWPEIFMMNGDGSNNRRLTRNERVDLHPHLSPDGTHLCYQVELDGIDTIHVMKVDGSADRAIATGALPVWSPNGSEIAYVALTANPSTSGTIWVIRPDGSNRTKITTTRY
jgi:Tol biopolymer transport system component